MTLLAGVAVVAILVFNGTFTRTTPVTDTPPIADAPPASETPIAEPVAVPPGPPSDAPPVVEREPARRPEPVDAALPDTPPRRAERAQIETARPSRPVVPLRAGGAIPPPAKIRNVRPDYPQIAQRARIQGFVILEATIGTTGKVENVRVIRSIPLLDQAAIDAVQQWEYQPTLLNGVPVPVIMTVTVNFTLSG